MLPGQEMIYGMSMTPASYEVTTTRVVYRMPFSHTSIARTRCWHSDAGMPWKFPPSPFLCISRCSVEYLSHGSTIFWCISAGLAPDAPPWCNCSSYADGCLGDEGISPSTAIKLVQRLHHRPSSSNRQVASGLKLMFPSI